LLNERQCFKLTSWNRAQRRFCKEHFPFVDIIRQAARLAMSECESQFKSRRWNCSSYDVPALFGKLPEFGMREASFLYALSSAALTYQVTRACTDGKLTECSCDLTKSSPSSNGAFKWSGCSENIAYGIGVSERFLDPVIRNKPQITAVNMHNLEVGRQVIERNMIKKCKCHGVSGSCELKTCWNTMPAFKQIANRLKQKYDSAIHVEFEDNKELDLLEMQPKNRFYEQLTKTDLVYLRKSPSFCKAFPRLAAFGTRGRECNKSSRGIDNCEQLCCGRSFTTRLEVIRFKCKCTFEWCCTVKCQECERIQEVSRCN
jgi:wingless-type MMTV integration site family protein 4